jgi:hypothetical protein
MGPLALLVFMSLAAYRVTRLVVNDSFPPVQRLRDWALGADERRFVGTRLEWVGELLTCNWCASFWVSGLVVGATEVVVSVPLPFLAWWAVAGATAFVLFVEDMLYGWANVNLKQAQALDRGRKVELTVAKAPTGY